MPEAIIEVALKPQYADAQARGAQHSLNLAGEVKISESKSAHLYKLSGSADPKEAAMKLLCDPVTETWKEAPLLRPEKGFKRVEIWPKDSVTDVTGESVADAVAELFGNCKVRCGEAYLFKTDATAQQLSGAVLGTLANGLIHRVTVTE
jgi:phosphoribosylformylglycinamidine (FGAM) synthase PurS component